EVAPTLPADATTQSSQAAPAAMSAGNSASAFDPNNPATWGKVARNAPCPCGSGKKYKHCHGAVR
ncbi:MAG: SEC-C metal-binding domain-containing protein, partial [Pseudomonadota bacterium]|nr:SEC-C metal-binding domain-containing protein [Pseudomonadota bacterium]